MRIVLVCGLHKVLANPASRRHTIEVYLWWRGRKRFVKAMSNIEPNYEIILAGISTPTGGLRSRPQAKPQPSELKKDERRACRCRQGKLRAPTPSFTLVSLKYLYSLCRSSVCCKKRILYSPWLNCLLLLRSN